MSKLTPHVASVPDSPSVTLANISNVAAAIQKQVTRDFGPVWGIDATVDAFDKLESVPVDYRPVIVRDESSSGEKSLKEQIDERAREAAKRQDTPGSK